MQANNEVIVVSEEKHHKTNKKETHTSCFILRHSQYRHRKAKGSVHKAQQKSHGYISGDEINHEITHNQTNL